jgi:TP901 family phage tail tape measure protein
MPVDAGSIYSDVRVRLDKLRGDLQSVNAQFDNLAARNAQHAGQFGANWSNGAGTATKALSAFNIGAVAAFTAVAMAVKKSIQMFGDFEQAMANTQSVTRSSAEDFKKLEAAALEAGETTRFSAKEAADAMYYLGSAGWNATQIMDGLNGVLQLAGATQSDLAFTSEMVTATISQFNLQAAEAGRVANVMAAGCAVSQATIDKLATSMSYVGPVAASMNMSLEDTVGVLSILYNNGLEASTAGTALRSVLADLSNAVSPATKKLAEFGITFDKTNPATNSFAQIIENLNPIMNDGGKIMQVFGDRAGPAMIKLLQAGREEIEKYTKSVTGTNFAAEAYATQNDTLNGSLDMLKNAYEGLSIRLGSLMAPALRVIIDLLTGFLHIISAVIGAVLSLGDVFSGTAGEMNTLVGRTRAENVELEKMSKRYLELQRSQTKTTADLAEMEKIKKRLLQIDPKLNQYIDSQTGALDLNEEALRKVNRQLLERERLAINEQKRLLETELKTKQVSQTEIDAALAMETAEKGRNLTSKERERVIARMNEGNTAAAEIQAKLNELEKQRLALLSKINEFDNPVVAKKKAEVAKGAPATAGGTATPATGALDIYHQKVTELHADEISQYRQYYQTVDQMDQEFQTAREKREEEAAKQLEENMSNMIDTIAAGAPDLISAFSGLFSAINENRLAELDEQMQAELEAAGVSEESAVSSAQNELDAAVKGGDAQVIAEKQKALKKAKIEEEYQKKRAKLEYEAAKTKWQFDLALAVASGAQAILNAWNSALFPFNIPAIAIATTLAGVQVGTVMASEPKAPSFETGGIVPGESFTGDRVTAMVNSGEMILNRAQQTRLLAMINAGQGVSGDININNDFGGIYTSMDEDRYSREMARRVKTAVRAR